MFPCFVGFKCHSW